VSENGVDSSLLADIRARLLQRGKMPDLPVGWRHQSAMLAAQGFEYGGDFIVADISEDGRRLQMVLVDVCGSGETAVPTALQFAGALESLVCAVPSEDVLGAANAYLLRQPEEEAFATAVQVELDLDTGDYVIRSAGHPPALRWSPCVDGWHLDNARGTALGVTDTPDLDVSTGNLAAGDSLLFYTDGVVESRSQHIDTGIAWLQQTAENAVREGWDGAAARIIDLVTLGDDDRAVLLLGRDPEYS
jgi:serine phosphatase RsbU (regulator of sigma subunit)